MHASHLLFGALALALPTSLAQQLNQAPILPNPPTTTTFSSQLFNLTHLSSPSITTRTQNSRAYALRLSLLHSTAHSTNAAGYTPMFPDIALSKDEDPTRPQRIQVPLKETCCFGLNERSPEDFPTRKFAEGLLVTEIGRKGSRGTGVVALVVVKEGLEIDVTADKRGQMKGEVVVVVHDRTKGEWVGSRFGVEGWRGGEVILGGEDEGVERKEMDEVEARELWVMKATGRRAEKVL